MIEKPGRRVSPAAFVWNAELSHNTQVRRVKDNKEEVKENKAQLGLGIPQAKRLGRILVIGDVAKVDDGDDIDNDGHVGRRTRVTVAAIGKVEYAA